MKDSNHYLSADTPDTVSEADDTGSTYSYVCRSCGAGPITIEAHEYRWFATRIAEDPTKWRWPKRCRGCRSMR